MLARFNAISGISGTLELPGDKSISHRALIFSAMAEGKSLIHNLSPAEDVRSTRDCLEKLGAVISDEEGVTVVNGRGFRNFIPPEEPLYAGNSGTTARLLAGLLAAQNFKSVITGDESLSVRPMKRIAEPLTKMGGRITTSSEGTLPLIIEPVTELIPVEYKLPVPSAQVKSAVLIAGLHSGGITSVIEGQSSRDHTEKMLGLRVEKDANGIISFCSRGNYPSPREYFIPADISTAAYFIVLALISENSELLLKNVSLNETRTGYLEILKAMGGDIEIINRQEKSGETLGDISIKSSRLRNIEIPLDIIPVIIDEVPVLAVAGAFASGEFKISGAHELRLKETDRIKAVFANMRLAGLAAEESEDGFSIKGNANAENPEFSAFGDHRIAMSFGIFSMLNKEGGSVNGFECVKISNPGFSEQLKSVVK